jgi:hypothetical protein
MWKIVIKVAVVVLILKEAWLLLQIPSVADALFSFIMVGAVPGTDKTLTPDQMIQLLVGVFILSVMLIFHKDLYRLAKRLMNRDRKADVAASDTVTEMPIEHPHEARTAVVAAAEVVPEPAQPSAVSQRMTGIRMGAARRFSQFRTAVAAHIQQWLSAARPVAIGYTTRAWHGTKRAARVAAKVLWITYIVIIALVMQLWSWLRPRLERFDRWLDKKMHQNEFTAGILAVGKDVINAYRKALADVRTTTPKEPTDN